MAKISVRQFIEAAIFFSDYRCSREIDGEVCGGQLQQVWITLGEEDEEPILNYIECKKCNAEVALLIAFVYEKETGE